MNSFVGINSAAGRNGLSNRQDRCTFRREHERQRPALALAHDDNHAALAGLIFVAMSIKPEVIIQNTTHKNRAINMLSGFTAIFMACGFALIGNQPPRAPGIEWLVLWLIATAIFIRGYVVAIKAGVPKRPLLQPRRVR